MSNETRSSESTPAKSDSTYYHFKSTPKELAEQYKPKQLTQEEIEAQKLHNQSQNASGPSLWNKAGTWEEQSANDFALERMKSLFTGVNAKTSDIDVSITECESVDGEASIVYIRGKKKCAFELNVVLNWAGKVLEEEVTGTISLPDLDFTNIDDFEIEIAISEKNENHRKAKELLNKQIPSVMYQRMNQFVEE